MIKNESELYKAMYYKLFNAVTDALNFAASGDGYTLCQMLRKAQQDTEEIFISYEATILSDRS